MPSNLQFPEVVRATRRAWLHVAFTSALGVTAVGMYLLGTEAALPFPWYVALPFGLSCYALSLALTYVLDQLRSRNSAGAAEVAPLRATSPLALRSAAWLARPVAWLPARWLQPRLEWNAHEVVLAWRGGLRRIPKAEIRFAHASPCDLVLVLRSGETQTLRTTDLVPTVLEHVYTPLAQALLSARARALDFNQALARAITATSTCQDPVEGRDGPGLR